ncbi:MAG TPA: AlkA N-terminal domain-containing protein [Segeticoccus sp.]|uniref:DNA-3-methyladenine glycosylase family protein n=1 Tax=Segeticoccus sp. TaxID=2706531 RepID=UPI002D7E658B|nr:AlkA N-terminal domain-containing protein [Segeticoccus sp.]HET8601127.1 AlkA N-terminal domain-containing protein [Segeticoccus sp.]
MTVAEVELPEPLESRSVLGVLAAHAVPGIEQVDPVTGTVRRFVTLAGRPVLLTLTLGAPPGRHGGPARVLIEVEPAARDEAVVLVRRWLDLDRDLGPVRAVLATDPVLAPLVAARPGLRVTGYPDGFEAAVLTVLGQQVSVAAARTFGARLVQRYADPAPGAAPHPDRVAGNGEGPVLRCFPRPEALAGAEPEELRATLGVPAARARTVLALARACAEGLRLDASGDPTDLRHRLLELPGIGPWTAEYLALRAFGDADAFPATDLVLRRALGRVTSAEATRAAAAWSPYRAYAVVHLWAHAAYR